MIFGPTRSGRTARRRQGDPGSAAPVLVTGGAGLVATMIRPFMAGLGIPIRLSDLRQPADLGGSESFHAADLRDAGAVADAAAGCRAIVHLGGIAKDRDFETLLQTDMRGVIHVLDAAVRHGIERVVLASSLHVMGFYRRDEPVGPERPPRPDSRYALAKLFAEQAGELYSRKHGLRVSCLRLGHVTDAREDAEPGSWISPEDVAGLIGLGLQHPGIRYEVLHAVAPYSGDDAQQRDLERRLGFRFRHPGTSYAQALREADRHFSFDTAAQAWRGGVFASRDGEPD